MNADWQAPQEDIDAIVAARHPDPFALLGQHATPAGRVIRALVPDAQALSVIDRAGATIAHMDARGGGFFEGLVPGQDAPLDYRLRASNAGGSWTFADPYAFGPVLGATDDHLLVEGTHRRLYERLGAHPLTHARACRRAQVVVCEFLRHAPQVGKRAAR